MAKTKQKAEFGDFQTPPELAHQVCQLLHAAGCSPQSIIEPTCGLGSILLAAVEQFTEAEAVHGLEINGDYLDQLSTLFGTHSQRDKVKLHHADFFTTDWSSMIGALPEPILIVGNPPWVTSAELGRLDSENLPQKTNRQNHSGLDALTGKSNFDVSEWMLTRLIDVMDGRNGTLAVLCKTAVARKVLGHAWQHGRRIENSAIYEIDAMKHFVAAVDACLLVCEFDPRHQSQTAAVRSSLVARDDHSVLGWRENQLVASVEAFDEHRHLRSDEGRGPCTWRSGIKHDCSPVMELREVDGQLANKLGEVIDIEDDYLFPMLKSSDVANGRTEEPVNWMLVTQRVVGGDTAILKNTAPNTWTYLCSHADRLNARRSSIYRNRPQFSIFGIGSYTFAPYKVAISGFYKRLSFEVIGSYCDKPIVLDDTVYFLPCQSHSEATFLAELLNSSEAAEFFSGYVFWDAKRPITVDLLRKLDLRRLALQIGRVDEFDDFAMRRGQSRAQPTLF